jgi:hypothetical protein
MIIGFNLFYTTGRYKVDVFVNYFGQLFWSIILVNCFGQLFWFGAKTTPMEFNFDNHVQKKSSTG